MASSKKQLKWHSMRAGGRVDSYQGVPPGGGALGRDWHRYDYRAYKTGAFGGPEGWKLVYRGYIERDQSDNEVGDEVDLGIYETPALAKKAAKADFEERNRDWDPEDNPRRFFTAGEWRGVEWAIGGMEAVADEDYGEEGLGYQPEDVPETMEEVVATTNRHVQADILYRLEEQMQDMADDEVFERPKALREARHGLRAAEKLRERWGFEGPTGLGFQYNPDLARKLTV